MADNTCKHNSFLSRADGKSESRSRLAENRETVVSAEFFNLLTPVVVPGVYRHYRRVVVTQSEAQTAEITQQQSDHVKLLLRENYN